MKWAVQARVVSRFRCVLACISLSLAACAVSEFDRIQTASQERARCASDGALDSTECPSPSDAGNDATTPELDAGLADAGWDDGAGEDDAGAAQSDASAAQSDASATSMPSEAGSAGEGAVPDAPMCSDVIKDPRNCGHCGLDCSATGARVGCENGMCNRVCEDGLKDCNEDLKLGAGGDGCERAVDSDALNCGVCRRRCVAPTDGYAACKAQQCSAYRLLPGTRSAGAQQGNTTGGAPFDLLCAEGQILTGLDVVGVDIAYGIRTRCASLRVARSGNQISVSLGPAAVSDWIGGIITGPPPIVERRCPEGMLVAGVSGTLWSYPGATSVPSVKTLVLSCAEARVTGDKVSLVAGPQVDIGDPEAVPLSVFSQPCSGAAAVAGFSGRAGSYLDAIAVHCATLGLREEPGASTTAAAD